MKYNILQAVQKNIYVNGKELGCLEIYSVFKNSKQPKLLLYLYDQILHSWQ